jgi:hypothetical protein
MQAAEPIPHTHWIAGIYCIYEITSKDYSYTNSFIVSSTIQVCEVFSVLAFLTLLSSEFETVCCKFYLHQITGNISIIMSHLLRQKFGNQVILYGCLLQEAQR